MSSSATSPSMEYMRSPFNNVLQILPEGHEKALKQAFYNTIALVFVVLVSFAAVAVYYILEVFVRSLLWAVLCGTFLHPFKNTLTRVLQRWLRGLRKSCTPLVVGTVAIPIRVVDTLSETVWYFIVNHWKLLLSLAITLPVLQILYYFGTLLKIVSYISNTLYFIYNMVMILSAKWVLTLIVAYMAIVIFYWRPGSSPYLKFFSLPVWIALFLQIATLTGPLKIPLVLALIVMLSVGCVVEMRRQARLAATELAGDDEVDGDESEPEVGRNQSSSTSAGTPRTQDVQPARKRSAFSLLGLGSTIADDTEPSPVPSATSGEDGNQRSLSDKCFIALFWALLLARLWVNVWIIQLLPAMLLFVVIKRAVIHIGGVETMRQTLGDHYTRVETFFVERRDALFPGPLRGLARIGIQGDERIVRFLERSLDGVISIFIILALIVGAISAACFVCVQVQQETMHLLTVSSNVLNTTLHPELTEWLPNPEDMQTAMDTMVSNAFVYGREYISSKVKHIVNGDAPDAARLENQILGVYDRLYESYVSRNASQGDVLLTTASNKPDPGLQLSNLTSLWSALQNLNGLDYGDIISYAQDNLGTVMSIVDSIWLVLKGNLNLVINIVTAILSALFGGGTAILNFIIASIVFLTTLFYLLSSSEDRYKPVELIMSMFPSESSPTANNFGNAVEAAISGVFMASFKMAAFYGLYTWLTHTLFQIKIVFIPSALAALFGAIPFLGTYWAALPAVIELWLVQGDGVRALMLFICQILPSYVVDTAIYSEIKGGGHPYLTGLAIVGGVYWMGIEGAIIGPIILCSLVVLVNVCSTVMRQEGGSQVKATSTTTVLKEDKRLKYNLQRGHTTYSS